ncbi:zinc finger domain-containing protein [Amycolatopsis heterodermiae]
MTRGKQHANGRDGLWQGLPDQDYVPAHDLRIEQETSPLTRPCSFCHAAPRQPCTRPARGGRTPLRSYHHSRLNPSNPTTRQAPQEQP